jgi:hypothetical protein
MKSKIMDFAIFWLPILGGILLGGLAGSAWYGGNKILGLWLAFAGAICLGLVFVLQIQQAIRKTQASENLLDNTIGFECAWSAPPSHYREDKTLFIVDFQGVPVTGINPDQQVAGPMSFRRSAEPFEPSDHYSDIWYRCNITNYGTLPVRNLRAKFPVQFAEAELTQNGTQSGKIVASGYALTPSIDLGTGSAGSNYFYFANASVVFIHVGIPPTAVLQTMADDEWHVVKLIPTSAPKRVFTLLPSDNPLHPTPTSPPQPTK